MGRNTSTDKLLLRRWAYSWGHKDGNDLVNTQRCRKTYRSKNKAREDTKT